MVKKILVVRHIPDWFAVFSRGLYILGGVTIWVMMILTITGVVMRYVVKRPFIGAFEASESYLLIAATLLALAMVQQERRHIQITLLTGRLSPLGKLISNLLIYTIALSICGFIGYSSWLLLLQAASENILLGGMAGLPLWPSRILVFFGFSWLGLQFLKDLVITVQDLFTLRRSAT